MESSRSFGDTPMTFLSLEKTAKGSLEKKNTSLTPNKWKFHLQSWCFHSRDSGQVFVSTAGGENHKPGAVKIFLFAREAIDTLLPKLKIYADLKIQELSPSVDVAKTAVEQAEAAKRIASVGEWTQAFETEWRARDNYKLSKETVIPITPAPFILAIYNLQFRLQRPTLKANSL